MVNYLIRRLLLLPVTLFCILLVNFVIINLAPGDPVTVTEISEEGAASRKEGSASAYGSDERYLQFREHYGLTLPILFNNWPSINQEQVNETLFALVHKKASAADREELPFKEYDKLRILFGDQAQFVMPKLLHVIEDPATDLPSLQMAIRYFIRGGTKQAFLGSDISEEEKAYNKKISRDNYTLRKLQVSNQDSEEVVKQKIAAISKWYEENKGFYHFEPDSKETLEIFFTKTRFFRYFTRVLTLDFGTIRNDQNKTVISEVTKRFKYSLTLSILPMVITFFFCMLFGMVMALKQSRWQDLFLSVTFLILYAIPIFVVAPFLIEKVALGGHFPFTNTPIPLSGFTSPEAQYEKMLSYERLLDVFSHIALPLVAIIYGTLAVQSRLARTALLEVIRLDYVRTAVAKGLPTSTILFKHVSRNAAITIVTALASSLGVILGGSLIVETLFEIDGFGKFFYDAIINRDYNVIMFSAIAGAFLSLVGFLVADIAYTLLDPRVSLE